MGLLKGSISYAKFYVEGTVPENHQEMFLEALQLRRFVPLTVDGEDEQRVGWSPVSRPLEAEVAFDHNDVFYNAYLNVSLRVDAWRFPGPVFKAAFAEAEKKYLTKKGRDKLTKREKEELKVTVGRKLRHQISPTIRVIDLSWNLAEGTVRFWSQSNKAQEMLFEIWEKTFAGVELVPAGAYTTAERASLSEARLKALTEVEPATFHAA